MDVRAFISGCAGPVLSDAEARFFADSQPWGLIVFKRNIETPAQLARLTAAFRSAVGRPGAPVLIDQEGGRVQRMSVPHWPRYPAARLFSALDPATAPATARAVYRCMAGDLADVGINVNCIPVLDVPTPDSHGIIGDRAYALAPPQITRLARAAVDGMNAGGVGTVMKHIPGHGRARVDSHRELPVVEASRHHLEATDFAPFKAMSDLSMAMTAHVVYSCIDPHAPATVSSAVVGGIIRGHMGFDGLLMTDDLSMGALGGTLRERCHGALGAGCDMLLHCNGDMNEMNEVAAAAPVLSARSLDRARRALAAIGPPQPYERADALEIVRMMMAESPEVC